MFIGLKYYITMFHIIPPFSHGPHPPTHSLAHLPARVCCTRYTRVPAALMLPFTVNYHLSTIYPLLFFEHYPKGNRSFLCCWMWYFLCFFDLHFLPRNIRVVEFFINKMLFHLNIIRESLSKLVVYYSKIDNVCIGTMCQKSSEVVCAKYL